MAGIPSGEGSGDARNRSTIWERFPPYPAHVVRFYHEHKDILGEILSGLSHLPTHEMMDALGEVRRSVVFPVAMLRFYRFSCFQSTEKKKPFIPRASVKVRVRVHEILR
jgi:hypothetical protein